MRASVMRAGMSGTMERSRFTRSALLTSGALRVRVSEKERGREKREKDREEEGGTGGKLERESARRCVLIHVCNPERVCSRQLVQEVFSSRFSY